MNIIRNAFIIALMKSVPEIKRQPLIVLMFVGLSAIPLLFIGIFGGEAMMNYGLVGAIVSSVGFLGVSSPIQEISWDRHIKLREMMVAMPIHPLSYALGLSMGSLIFSLPGLVLFIVLLGLRGVLTAFALVQLLAAVALCWGTLSVIGFTIATYLYKSSAPTLGMISTLLSFVLVFLPPVYYPETLAGANGWIVYIFPTSNAAAIIRFATGVVPMDGVAFAAHWTILLITCICFGLLAAFKSRWRDV